MKNPFVRESNSGMMAIIAASAVLAGCVSYLFFSRNGKKIKAGWKSKAKEKFENAASDIVSKKTGVSKKIVKKAADLVV
jgi:spermidine/putrescine-binding protein